MTEEKQKTKGCLQKARTESEEYAGVQTVIGISHESLLEVNLSSEMLLETIMSRGSMCIWKSWKLPRTRVRNLIKCGMPQWRACQWGNASKGYWAVAGSAIMQVAASNRNLARAGHQSLLGYYEKYHCRLGTAVCGPACTVV